MDQKIIDLLNELGNNDLKEEDGYPLVLLGDRKEPYNIPSHKTTSFWSNYCNIIYNEIDAGYLAEYGSDICPVIVDFTFIFPPSDKDEGAYYNQHLIFFLIHTIQSVLKDHLNITSNDYRELIACHLENEGECDIDDEINGILHLRFHFPYCHVSRNIQRKYLYPDLLKRLHKIKHSEVFLQIPSGRWSDALNVNIWNEPIPLFGSISPNDIGKLELSEVWPYIPKEKLEAFKLGQADIEELSLDGLFTFQNHIHDQRGWLNRQLFLETNDPDYWLPMFLSLDYWGVETQLKPPSKTSEIEISPPKQKINHNIDVPSEIEPPADRNPIKEISTKGKEPTGSSRIRKYVIEDENRVYEDDYDRILLEGNHFDIAQELLPLINAKRFTKINYWNEISQAIHHSCNGHDKGLQLLKDYTENYCNVHNSQWEIECENYYRSCSKSKITIKTLAWYAKEDNPKEYSKWHERWILESMNEALSGLDNDIARCFYKCHWLKYICTPCGQSVRWWEFRNHRWNDIQKGIHLRRQLSNSLCRKFGDYRIRLSRQAIDPNVSDSDKLNCERDIKRVGDLIKKLKSANSKRNVMTETVEYFLHDDFEDWMDDNDFLTGVDNGVLEICGHKCKFRKGKPEDFITKSALVGYDKRFDNDHPLVKECKVWIKQLFMDDELVKHFFKYCSSFLKSGNREKYFVVFAGANGDNGKSMICKLLGLLGGYCVRMSLSFLTQGRQRTNTPSPDMARSRAAKVAIMQEPEDDDKLQGGVLKDATGNEPFFCRFLNDNGREIRNTFKLILMCNNIPSFNNPGQALVNRMKVFPFLSTWSKDAPKTEEERYKKRIFQMDPNFEDRINVLMPAFLWLMKEYYPVYSKEGLKDPQAVIEYTEKYWASTNIYKIYLSERLENVYTPKGDIDTRASITLSQLYLDFKNFLTENYTNNNLPDRRIVCNNISSIIGPLCGNKWYGIRIKSRVANIPSMNDEGSSYSNEGEMIIPTAEPTKTYKGIIDI